MTEPVGGIDPHQDTFTVGIVDPHGAELVHDTFPNTAAGYGEAIDLLDAHGVGQVGVEGSAKWGAHVAVALCAAGFDAREVPASRSAAQCRSRRLDKTDADGAVASARALLAEPTLGPVQALEAYDAAVAEIEAVLEHRRTLVAARTLMLHHIGDQITRAAHRGARPARHDLQDRSAAAYASKESTPTHARPPRAGIGSNGSRTSSAKTALRAARSADWNGSSTTCSTPTAPPCATSQASAPSQPRRCCARSATPPGSTASRSSPAGAASGAVALSSGEGSGNPVKHRLDLTGNRRINSVLHIASVTPQRTQPEAIAYLARKAGEPKTRREARRAHKRQLANRVIRRMWRDETARNQPFALAA